MRPDALFMVIHLNIWRIWLRQFHRSLLSRTDLRSASVEMFNVPRTRIRQGSQPFSVDGPRAWNTLPTAIKLLSCRATFKRHLKTFLFVQS